MARKQQSYTTIAKICGRLWLGESRKQVVKETGVTRGTVDLVRQVLWKMGALQKVSQRLPDELDQEIRRLVRSTRLSNQQIMRKLGLHWTGGIRARRKAFHDELRAKGEFVPQCKCGEEFQHAQKCPFKGIAAKRLDPLDEKDAARDLLAGVSLNDMIARYSLSRPAAGKLIRDLNPTQRKKRWANIAARNAASRRRNKRAGFDGLEKRLASALPATTPSDIKADALSEMYLSVTSGELTEQQAVSQVRSFVSKAYRSVSDQFAMPSLDAERDGLKLVDMIEDEGAFDEFTALDELELAG